MKIQQFTGGLSTRMRPQFLQTNEGAEYNNINSYKGSLVPVKDKVAQPDVLEQYLHYYIAKAEWVSKSVLTDYVEFNKKLYFTDRTTAPQVYDGTNTYQIGVDTPSQLTAFTINEHPEPVKEVTVKPDTDLTGLPVQDTFYLLVNSDSNKYSIVKEVQVDSNSRVLASDSTSFLNPFSTAFIDPYNFIANADPGTAEWQIKIKNPVGITIGGDGVKVYRLYQGVYRLVGTLATSTSTLTDSVHDISANETLDRARLGIVSGTIQYALTYYNSISGIESAPSLVSDELDMTKGGTVSLTSLPVSADPQVDKKRLYRIGGNLTSLTRMTEFSNATASYTDALGDLQAEGSLAVTSGNGTALTGLSFLTEAYAILFGAVGNKLVFTDIGEPWNWPALNFLTYEADITGLAITANGLLVFTEFRTHLVTGTGPSSFATQLLSGDQGCIAFESVVNLSNAALWVSTDGMCTSDGSQVIVVSKDKLDKLALTPTASAVYDEVYYVVSGDTTYAFDFGLGKVFKTFSLGISTLHVAKDRLYGWEAGVLYELFASEASTTMEYLSPRFIEGRATELKTYKKVYIYSKGDIILNIFIDDVLVATGSFSEENSHTIQVPQDKQRGFFIQFSIEGTGEVFELEYVTGGRNNG